MKKNSLLFFNIICFLTGGIFGFCSKIYLEKRKKECCQEKVDKFKGYYNILNLWLGLKQEGKSLEKYFIDNGYKTVAIYGMGEMGNHLYEELKDSNIVKVLYGIDKNTASDHSGLEIRDLDDDLDVVDVVVVTATFAYKEIKEDIEKRLNSKIVSLDDVILEV